MTGSQQRRQTSRGRRGKSRRLAIESLEQRLALTTPYVDSDIYFIDSPFDYVTVPQTDAVLSAAGADVMADDEPATQIFNQLPLGNYQLQYTDRTNLFGKFSIDSANSQIANSPVTNRGQVGPIASLLDVVANVKPKVENLLAGLGASLMETNSASDVVALVARPAETVDLFIERARVVGNILLNYQDAVGSPTSLRLVFSHGDDHEISVRLDSWFELDESGNAEQLFVSGTVNGADDVPASLESEGGAIPIEAIVANVASESIPFVSDAGAVADWTPKSGDAELVAANSGTAIAGELARAVAFEMIDGEAAPIVYAASTGSGGQTVTGQYVVTSTGHPALVVPNEQALAAVSNERGNSTIRIGEVTHRAVARDRHAIERGSGAWFMAASNWSASVEQSDDDLVASAFSQLGADEEEIDLAGESRPQLWLAAMPMLAVLAAERMASSKKRASADASSEIARG